MNAHEFKVIIILGICGILYDIERLVELGLVEETISMLISPNLVSFGFLVLSYWLSHYP